jgi:hypothetical protein
MREPSWPDLLAPHTKRWDSTRGAARISAELAALCGEGYLQCRSTADAACRTFATAQQQSFAGQRTTGDGRTEAPGLSIVPSAMVWLAPRATARGR